jgi:hypothetical protein
MPEWYKTLSKKRYDSTIRSDAANTLTYALQEATNKSSSCYSSSTIPIFKKSCQVRGGVDVPKTCCNGPIIHVGEQGEDQPTLDECLNIYQKKPSPEVLKLLKQDIVVRGAGEWEWKPPCELFPSAPQCISLAKK